MQIAETIGFQVRLLRHQPLVREVANKTSEVGGPRHHHGDLADRAIVRQGIKSPGWH